MSSCLTINFGRKRNFFGNLDEPTEPKKVESDIDDQSKNFSSGNTESSNKNDNRKRIKLSEPNSTMSGNTAQNRKLAINEEVRPKLEESALSSGENLSNRHMKGNERQLKMIRPEKFTSTIKRQPTPSAPEDPSRKSFDDININSRLISNLAKLDICSMTKIQELAIPSILSGKDCLVRAETGSGKTLTYALPIMHDLMERSPKIGRKDGIFVLVVVPTRELALQTLRCFEKLCKACIWIVPSHLIGGEKKKSEKARIRKGVNILIATPGRLLDHFDTTNCLSMEKVKYLVLDEADRMLEMGYEQSMKSIIMEIKKQQQMVPIARQNLLLSATLTSAVEKLANVSMKNPETIDVTNKTGVVEDLSSDTLATPENLNQYFMIVPTKSRLVTLSAFILQKCRLDGETKILVFFPSQDMVDYHSSIFIYNLARYGRVVQSSLQKRAENVLSGDQDDEHEDSDMDDDDCQNDGDAIRFLKLHGSMSQDERTSVFREFTETSAGVLLCTDVASRGLDLPKVDWIVQYNGAPTPALYVHRVGRTARANMIGNAVVFLTPDEAGYVNMLEEKGIELQEIHMESILMNLTNSRLHQNLHPRQLPKTKEQAATNMQVRFEELNLKNKEFNDMASAAFISFIRSYASFPKEAREVFRFHELHLGHVAKSFGLRQTPTEIGKIFSKKCSKVNSMRQIQEKRFYKAKDKIMRCRKKESKYLKCNNKHNIGQV